MHSTMPNSSCQRKATDGSPRAFAVQAITPERSAKGMANSVWLKRIISRMCRRRCHTALLSSPALDQAVFDLELVANSGHDKVDEILYRSYTMIEAGHGREHDGARLGCAAHVF